MEIILKALDDVIGDVSEKDKKMEKETFKPDVKKLMNSIEVLRTEISMVAMEPRYIQNTRQHRQIWVPNNKVVENAYILFIDEVIVNEIMELM